MGHKILFITGLIFFLIGQIILAQGNEYVYNLKPIDFAHWSLLIGAVLLIPQVINFPGKWLSYIGIPLTMIGICCLIGMCVLDFIAWSFPDDAGRNEFFTHISQFPAIWKPFMTIGPSSKVFNLGLLILSLNYFKKEKVGVLFVFLACLVLWRIIPVPYRLVTGYALTLVGFSLLFFRKSLESFSELSKTT